MSSIYEINIISVQGLGWMCGVVGFVGWCALSPLLLCGDSLYIGNKGAYRGLCFVGWIS